jgi:predicted MFS family arabinose efflux permease
MGGLNLSMMNFMRKQNKFQPISILFAGLFILNGTTQSLFLPALPQIVEHFEVATFWGKALIPSFLAGVLTCQLFIGYLSDLFGKFRIMLILIAIYIVGALIGFSAPDIFILLLGMFVQGVGVGSIFALTQASMTDLYPKEIVAQKIGMITFSITWVTALGILIGGSVTHHMGWRYTFLVLGLYALLLYRFLWKASKKGLEKDATKNHRPTQSYLSAYKSILSNKTFLKFAVCFAFVYSGQSVFYALSPFVIVHELQISPKDYGAMMFIPIGGLMLGRLLSASIRRKTNHVMVAWGLPLLIGGALLMFWRNFPPYYEALLIMTAMGIYLTGQGMISPNARAGVMSTTQTLVASASTLMSLVTTLIAMLLSFVVARFFEHHLEQSLLTIAVMASAWFIVFWLLAKKSDKSN